MAEVQSMLQKMLAKSGKTMADFRSGSLVGKAFRQQGVERTRDLERVINIPRRVWSEDGGLSALASDLTDWLALKPRQECRRRCGHPKTDLSCPECVRASNACVCGGEGRMALRPLQAKALEELHDFGGLLALIRVGGGKTLISMLSPVVLAAERPLLFVPAKLRDKTLREFALLRRHWLFHPKTAILSYEMLSRDGGWEMLQNINPDLVVCDEVHRLKSLASGCTRKARRWQKEHPECRWALMSGTITTRSLRDYAHLAKWSLKDWSPLPTEGDEVASWADALDTKVPINRRRQPGALLGLCDDAELTAVAADSNCATAVARGAFRRRLVQTPSVVATEERALGVSLEISHAMVDISKDCAADFRKLREDWETPDGHPFTEAVDLWRHARELACGLFYRWDPPAPDDWLLPRREWGKFVREMLSRRYKGIDTEFQVAKACKAGALPSDAYDAWTAVRDTFKPNSVPVWRHHAMITFAERWLKEAPGIVWTEHVAFAEELSRFASVPYFGEGGIDASGIPIETTPSDRAVASIASNSEGRNLQRWARCLVVSPPPNGRIWEQMLGRCHREGQEADEVEYTIVFACREQWEGFQQAIADARYVEETTGQPQKLLYADKDIPGADEVAGLGISGNPMWSLR